jgi:hypothetical protein
LEEVERLILAWVVVAFSVSNRRVSLDLRGDHQFQKHHRHRLLLLDLAVVCVLDADPCRLQGPTGKNLQEGASYA